MQVLDQRLHGGQRCGGVERDNKRRAGQATHEGADNRAAIGDVGAADADLPGTCALVADGQQIVGRVAGGDLNRQRRQIVIRVRVGDRARRIDEDRVVGGLINNRCGVQGNSRRGIDVVDGDVGIDIGSAERCLTATEGGIDGDVCRHRRRIGKAAGVIAFDRDNLQRRRRAVKSGHRHKADLRGRRQHHGGIERRRANVLPRAIGRELPFAFGRGIGRVADHGDADKCIGLRIGEQAAEHTGDRIPGRIGIAFVDRGQRAIAGERRRVIHRTDDDGNGGRGRGAVGIRQGQGEGVRAVEVAGRRIENVAAENLGRTVRALRCGQRDAIAIRIVTGTAEQDRHALLGVDGHRPPDTGGVYPPLGCPVDDDAVGPACRIEDGGAAALGERPIGHQILLVRRRHTRRIQCGDLGGIERRGPYGRAAYISVECPSGAAGEAADLDIQGADLARAGKRPRRHRHAVDKQFHGVVRRVVGRGDVVPHVRLHGCRADGIHRRPVTHVEGQNTAGIDTQEELRGAIGAADRRRLGDQRTIRPRGCVESEPSLNRETSRQAAEIGIDIRRTGDAEVERHAIAGKCDRCQTARTGYIPVERRTRRCDVGNDGAADTLEIVVDLKACLGSGQLVSNPGDNDGRIEHLIPDARLIYAAAEKMRCWFMSDVDRRRDGE